MPTPAEIAAAKRAFKGAAGAVKKQQVAAPASVFVPVPAPTRVQSSNTKQAVHEQLEEPKNAQPNDIWLVPGKPNPEQLPVAIYEQRDPPENPQPGSVWVIP